MRHGNAVATEAGAVAMLSVKPASSASTIANKASSTMSAACENARACRRPAWRRCGGGDGYTCAGEGDRASSTTLRNVEKWPMPPKWLWPLHQIGEEIMASARWQNLGKEIRRRGEVPAAAFRPPGAQHREMIVDTAHLPSCAEGSSFGDGRPTGDRRAAFVVVLSLRPSAAAVFYVSVRVITIEIRLPRPIQLAMLLAKSI